MSLLKKKINLTWNYRIRERIYPMDKEEQEDYIKSMKSIFGDDYESNLEPDIFYDVVEVYYGENNTIISWTDGIAPWRKF